MSQEIEWGNWEPSKSKPSFTFDEIANQEYDRFNKAEKVSSYVEGAIGAYDRRNDDIFKATGEKLFNPLRDIPSADDLAEMQAAYRAHVGAGNVDKSRATFQQEWFASRYDQRLNDVATKYPHLASVVKADRSPILDHAEAAQRAEQKSAEMADRLGMVDVRESMPSLKKVPVLPDIANLTANIATNPKATVAQFWGGLQAQMQDPVEASMNLLGFGAGRASMSVLKTAMLNAAANAAVEAAANPLRQYNRKEMGLDYGWDRFFADVSGAAATGAMLDAGVRIPYRAAITRFGRDVPEGQMFSKQGRGGILTDAIPQMDPIKPVVREKITPEEYEKAKTGDIDAIETIAKKTGIYDDPAIKGMLDHAKLGGRIDDEMVKRFEAMKIDHGEGMATLRAAIEVGGLGYARMPDPIPQAARALDTAGAAELAPRLAEINQRLAEAPQNVRQAIRAGIEAGIPEIVDAARKAVSGDLEGMRKAIADAGGEQALTDRVIVHTATNPISVAMALRRSPGVMDSNVSLRTDMMRMARAIAALDEPAFRMVLEGKAHPLAGQIVADMVPPGRHAQVLEQVANFRSMEDAKAAIPDLIPEPSRAPEATGTRVSDPAGPEAKAQIEDLEKAHKTEVDRATEPARKREELESKVETLKGEIAKLEEQQGKLFAIGDGTATPIEKIGPDAPHPGKVIAYHGSPSRFDKFDSARITEFGFHFGSERAASTARDKQLLKKWLPFGGNVRPVELDIKNPIAVTDVGRWDDPFTVAYYLNRDGGLQIDWQKLPQKRKGATEQQLADGMKTIKTALAEQGFDGIRYINHQEGAGAWSYIVWNEGQVKNARTQEQMFAIADRGKASLDETILSPPEQKLLAKLTERTGLKPDDIAEQRAKGQSFGKKIDAALDKATKFEGAEKAADELATKRQELRAAERELEQVQLDQARTLQDPALFNAVMRRAALQRQLDVRRAIDDALRLGNQMLPEGTRVDVRTDEMVDPASVYRLDASSDMATGDIALATYALNPAGRIGHEGVHTLITKGHIAPEEVKLLAKMARERGLFKDEAKYREAYANRDNLDALIDEEAAAHAIEARINGTDIGPANTMADRIKQLIERIKNALDGYGFKTADDVARAIIEGRAAEREARADWMRGEARQKMKEAAERGVTLPDGTQIKGVPLYAIRAFHGSPHDFDKFDISKIGSGEGAQAFGFGLYFAESSDVANSYRSALSARNVPSPADKARADILSRNAEKLGELAVSNSALVKDFGTLDVKTRSDMLTVMSGLLKDREIAGAVVRLVPVDVMDMLRGKELSAKALLDDPTVLVNLLPRNADDAVASGVKAVNELSTYVAFAAAERSLPGTNGRALLEKAIAARVANQSDLGHLGKIPEPFDPGNGRLYEVNIKADPADFLDWDKPLSQQPEYMRSKLEEIIRPQLERRDAADNYYRLKQAAMLEDAGQLEKAAAIRSRPSVASDISSVTPGEFLTSASDSAALREAGIPGIKYLDQGSRTSGEGSRNYVVFDDSLVEIVAKDGKPVNREQMFAIAERDATPIESIGPNDKHPGKVLAYHGSPTRFDTFDADKIAEFGFHFGSQRAASTARDKQLLKKWLPFGGNVRQVVLDIKNPIAVSDVGRWDDPFTVAYYLNRDGGLQIDWQKLPQKRKGATEQQLADGMGKIKTALAEQGFDGIRYINHQEGAGAWSYIVWNKGQVTTPGDNPRYLFALAGSDAAVGRSMRADLDRLGYYSKALESAKSLKQAKGTPEQMLAQLKAAGVKDAEIEATNLRGFLDGKTSITRDEIVKHLTENRVGVNEVVAGGTDGDWTQRDRNRVSQQMFGSDHHRLTNEQQNIVDRALEQEAAAGLPSGVSRPAKWSNYSLDPSNPTYRETVLHLPDEDKPVSFEVYQQRAGVSDAIARQLYDKYVANWPASRREFQTNAAFQSGHFSEPNIIGHMMTSLNKHEGKPVFTLDQIQSDWGQKLRDGGVRDEAKIAELRSKVVAAKDAMQAAGAEKPVVIKRDANGFLTPETAAEFDRVTKFRGEYDRLAAELRTAEQAASGHPLVNTTDQWTITTLRRALRQAVEADAEFIAIPHGDTVLSYNPGDEGGMRGFYGSRTSEGIVPKNLRKLLEKIDKDSAKPIKVETLETTKGQEGWQGHYLSDATDKFDKWDVSQTGFTLFPLTDKVKRSVMEEGQALFALSRQPLDMSPEARKARAEQMGFDTNTVWYHGTPEAGFDAFEARTPTMLGEPVDTRAVYASTNPSEADLYAGGSDGAALIPFYTKAKLATLDEIKYIPKDKIIETLAERGYGGYYQTASKSYAVIFDPTNIRSVNATFDPAEAGSARLLAAFSNEIEQVWGPKFDILMGQQYRIAEAASDFSTMYDILTAKLSKASGIEPEMRAGMEAKLRELYNDMGPDGRRAAGIADRPELEGQKAIGSDMFALNDNTPPDPLKSDMAVVDRLNQLKELIEACR